MRLAVGLGLAAAVVSGLLLVSAQPARAQGDVQYGPPPPVPPPYNPPPGPPPPYVYEPPPPPPGGYTVERVPAQHARVPLELTPSIGYAFSSGVPVAGGTLAMRGSPTFGATLDVGNWYGARFEASYMLQSTGIQFEPDYGANQALYDMTVHHFQLGGEFDILPGRVRPFLGVTLGAAWMAPHSALADEVWFEGSFEVGAKVRVTRRVGIRAQAMVTTIAMDSSSNIFCGNGCYTDWYGGIGTTQLAFMVGPTLGF